MMDLVYIMCKMVNPYFLSSFADLEEKMVFRSLGEGSAVERMGCGFMKKEGIRRDQVNTRFSSYALVYVIRGRGEYLDEDGEKWDLEAGSLFQRHPGRLHSTLLDPESAWRECFLDLGPVFYQALAAMRIIRPGESPGRIPPGSGVEEEFYRMMCSLEEAGERELPRCGMDILQLTASLLERADQGEDPEWRMVEQSCRDFSDAIGRRIDLRAYCRKRGWGYESFRKAFARKMGMPPQQYIIRRRMDEACRLLRSGRLNVKDTATRLGYRSPYEFSAQFRRMTGWSPRDYRGLRNQLMEKPARP